LKFKIGGAMFVDVQNEKLRIDACQFSDNRGIEVKKEYFF
jgi:hypothetical protein